MALIDVPANFNPDSEEDLRFAVAQYFHDLGFDLAEMSFEDRFEIQLGHNAIVVRRDQPRDGRVGGRSDLLLTRNGRSLAVVETKAPGNRLTDQDALQALSYARLLLDMAPFAIVTNGQETRVYDTFSRELTLIPDPSTSTWQTNGQQIPIDEDLKFEAMRTLIGINAQTLHAFCTAQVIVALEDLKVLSTKARSIFQRFILPGKLPKMPSVIGWLVICPALPSYLNLVLAKQTSCAQLRKLN